MTLLIRYTVKNRRLFIGLGLALSSLIACAQSYPTKPVRLIAASVGAGSDITARLVAPRLSERWGQLVVVENKPGAGATIAATAAAKSTPDGYTLLVGEVASLATVASFYKVPYDPTKDFIPISLLVKTPLVVLVHPSLPANTLQEFMAYAKQRPRAINYGTGAIGTGSHLGAALLGLLGGIDIVVVPYKGGGAALTAILGREIQLLLSPSIGAVPHVKTGRLRALGVTGRTRIPDLPDVPTVAEAAISGFEATIWYGLVAPTRTPADIVAKLNRDVTELLRTREIQSTLLTQGTEPSPTTPKEFSDWINSETTKWDKVIKALGIKPA